MEAFQETTAVVPVIIEEVASSGSEHAGVTSTDISSRYKPPCTSTEYT